MGGKDKRGSDSRHAASALACLCGRSKISEAETHGRSVVSPHLNHLSPPAICPLNVSCSAVPSPDRTLVGPWCRQPRESWDVGCHTTVQIKSKYFVLSCEMKG